MATRLLQIIILCPECGRTITDPTVILAARQMKRDPAVRLACIECQGEGRGDVEMVEKEVERIDEFVDVSDTVDR